MCKMYGIIESLCKERGIKPGRLCADIGISRGIMGDLKAGRTKKLSVENTEKVASYFGVSVDYLLGSPRWGTTSFANGILAFRMPTEEDIQKKISELEPDTFDVVFRGNCIAITVDRDGGATKEQIEQVIESYIPKEQKEKPTPKGELENAIFQRLRDLESEELEDVNAYIDFLLSKRK